MPNDPHIASAVVALLTTYLLHSTLLLAAVWLGLAVTRSRSAALHEWLWKLAALAPLVTAPLQFTAADRFGDWSIWTLPPITLAASSDAIESPPREGEAPADPLRTTGVHDSSTRQEPRPPELASVDHQFDESALVEIVPGPTSLDPAAELDLPIIEPAPAVTITPTPIENVAIEPLRTDDHWIAATPAAQTPATATSPPIPDVKPTADQPTAADPRYTWRGPVSLVFAVLVLAGLVRIGWRSLLARRKLRRAETITAGELRTALDRLLQQRGISRPVRLAYSAAASEPAAGGVLRWVIVVPPGIEERLSAAEQQALLAHELAHLVRRDPVWLWIGAALCSCLPFQLLNFLAMRRWRQASEELCDDWAISGGVRPLTLANCLTRVAEWKLSPMPVGLTADIGKSRFARRIGRLINGETHTDRWSRPQQRRLLLAGALGCFALLTCCGPRMQAGATRESPERNDATVATTPAFANHRQSESDAESSSAPIMSLAPSGGEGGRRPGEGLEATPSAQQAELAALLADLQRVEQLIGELGDDPEIDAVRTSLRARLETLRTRMPSDTERKEATADER